MECSGFLISWARSSARRSNRSSMLERRTWGSGSSVSVLTRLGTRGAPRGASAGDRRRGEGWAVVAGTAQVSFRAERRTRPGPCASAALAKSGSSEDVPRAQSERSQSSAAALMRSAAGPRRSSGEGTTRRATISGGIVDLKLAEEEGELLAQRLPHGGAVVFGELPEFALEGAEQLLARLVDELLLGVGRLALVGEVLPAVARTCARAARRGSEGWSRRMFWKLVARWISAVSTSGKEPNAAGRQRRGAVLHRAREAVLLASDGRRACASVSKSMATSAMEPSGSTTPPCVVPDCTEILESPASFALPILGRDLRQLALDSRPCRRAAPRAWSSRCPPRRSRHRRRRSRPAADSGGCTPSAPPRGDS